MQRQGSVLFEHKLCIATSPCCEFDQEEELRNVNKFIAIDTRDGMLYVLTISLYRLCKRIETLTCTMHDA